MGCKLIIFDLDGTLLDTDRGISKCIASTLGKMGFKVPDEETCKTFVGPPLKKRFLELFDADENTADAVMKAFREEYGKGDVFLADRYAGMEECLTALHEHFSLAVATKTKNQIVEKATNLVGVNPAESLLVGDSANDAERFIAR